MHSTYNGPLPVEFQERRNCTARAQDGRGAHAQGIRCAVERAAVDVWRGGTFPCLPHGSEPHRALPRARAHLPGGQAHHRGAQPPRGAAGDSPGRGLGPGKSGERGGDGNRHAGLWGHRLSKSCTQKTKISTRPGSQSVLAFFLPVFYRKGPRLGACRICGRVITMPVITSAL